MSDSLPYNSTILNNLFTPLMPEDKPDHSPGFWIILQGSSLLLPVASLPGDLPEDPLPEGLLTKTELLRIGLWQGKPLRTARIATDSILSGDYEAIPFQGADTRLDNILASIAGRAAQILHWERRSRFCPVCGGELLRIPASWGKHCRLCGEEHFPHIHPCIIVLVRRGAELLLIRNVAWNPGRFSLVAGFVDFGESLEECVKREVREESGIEVSDIQYVGSQCWPFPSQQMVGFIAEYKSGEVRPDGVEIAEARWFYENAIPMSPGSKRSISRWIMHRYAKNCS